MIYKDTFFVKKKRENFAGMKICPIFAHRKRETTFFEKPE